MRQLLILCLAIASVVTGCVKVDSIKPIEPFEQEKLDGCMAILVDMSGSFASHWDERAYDLFIELSESYFVEARGGENRLVIAALSGSDRVVLFEGRPSDLQAKFKSPADLSQFLKQQSDASRSRVYESLGSTLDYMTSMAGVSGQTRLMTVVLSDMVESEPDRALRRTNGYKMLEAMKRYQQAGGGLALYFVANDQVPQWRKILGEAGFESGRFVIENELTNTPRLPQFN